MNAKDTLMLGLVAAGVYFAWKTWQRGEQVIDTASTAIADLWLKLFPLPPTMELLGNVKFPGNIFIPLQQIAAAGAVKRDAQSNVFVKYSGLIWKLSPSNTYGNWEAVRV